MMAQMYTFERNNLKLKSVSYEISDFLNREIIIQVKLPQEINIAFDAKVTFLKFASKGYYFQVQIRRSDRNLGWFDVYFCLRNDKLVKKKDFSSVTDELVDSLESHMLLAHITLATLLTQSEHDKLVSLANTNINSSKSVVWGC